MYRSALFILFAAWLATDAHGQSLTLSPAVVPLRGSFGQSATHDLTLQNGSEQGLDFVLEAQDVVVRDGQRAFVAAGQIADSVASTAVFTPRQIHVPPGQSRSVRVTFTLSTSTEHRAVVALFRSTKAIQQAGRSAYLSLGTLFTFTLSESYSLAAIVRALPPTAADNTRLETLMLNDGREPLEPRGMAVILDASGSLVGKTALPARRLLPGERALVTAEYAGELAPGTYRAVFTLDFAGGALTRTAELVVVR